MAGFVDRYRHRTAATPAWPWFDEGRTLAQRLVGLPEDVIRVEESDEDGAHLVRAELPGIDPERDVEITITDGLLSVHAERHEEKKEKTPHGYRTEFRYGAFSRILPHGVPQSRLSQVRAGFRHCATAGGP